MLAAHAPSTKPVDVDRCDECSSTRIWCIRFLDKPRRYLLECRACRNEVFEGEMPMPEVRR